ncbi:MAG TPA: helicase-associated domain-containing protein, partial [Thermomicrobiales bacterium]|nr:helicase-associated domain-containing protein [Thermomicrobiales bacterium]
MTSRSALIFQRDGKLLVTQGEGLDEIIRDIRQCAQLRSIVAGNHVYELSPSALWGLAARGVGANSLLDQLERYAAMPVPAPMAARIAETMGRVGALEVFDGTDGVRIRARTPAILREIGIDSPNGDSPVVRIEPSTLGRIKLAAVEAGWPVIDRRRLLDRASPIVLNEDVSLRPYQLGALAAFRNGRDGVVLLPCGAGKTLVGVAAAMETGGPVLVLVPSRTVGEQWQAAFRDATDCPPSDIGWFSASDPQVVSTVTYHAATSGHGTGDLTGRRWRLVIFDEVQSLPADVFRLASGIDADRRLGLSATLVREDGREAEVFALVGPALYEASWLELERDGWIAPARCVEVRVPASTSTVDHWRYKMAVVQRLLERHANVPALVVGTDVASLRAAGRRLGFPVLTGSSSNERRAQVLDAFRAGLIQTIGLSRIGSVGIDLPDASVLIQVSGTFGSRQEEAQRLGRILRPASGKTAHFYTIVAAGTREQHFASRRQRFL